MFFNITKIAAFFCLNKTTRRLFQIMTGFVTLLLFGI